MNRESSNARQEILSEEIWDPISKSWCKKPILLLSCHWEPDVNSLLSHFAFVCSFWFKNEIITEWIKAVFIGSNIKSLSLLYFQGKEIFIYNENLDESGFSPEALRFLPSSINEKEIPTVQIKGSSKQVRKEYLRIGPIKPNNEELSTYFPPEILPDPRNNRGSFLLVQSPSSKS